MVVLKQYSNIRNFLQRYTLLQIGPLHIRLHHIKDKDRSTLLHTHPFHYLSIILYGGYTEWYLKNFDLTKVKHNRFHFIFRKASTYHRIHSVKPNTLTLFIAWGRYKWHAVNLVEDKESDGMHRRVINGTNLWAKRYEGIWFIGNKSREVAEAETRHSIYQIL